jgi:hypothetical protein
VKVTFLVYRSPDSLSLCDVDGYFKGDRLKMGCVPPNGWGSGGASGINGPDVPNPLFK